MTDQPDDSQPSINKEPTDKEWAFIYKFLECNNATTAYRHAYNVKTPDAPHHVQAAFRVKRAPHVTAIILELRQEMRQTHGVTVDTITQELEDARILAMATGTAGPAVSASMGKAKLHGLVIDKVDTRHMVPPVINLNGRPDPEPADNE